jgi:voltage-gated potassium channel
MLTEIAVAVVIVFFCLLLHVAGILLMAEWLFHRRQYFERSGAGIHFSILMVVLLAGIMVLHMVEAGIWAAFYYTRELFQDFETSLYFSLGSYAAIGYGDVLLPQRWRLVGAIEGVCGVLLCGISTAFLFAVMNATFKSRMQQRQSRWEPRLELTRDCKK